MLRPISVTEDNWMDVASLTVKEHQKGCVAPAIGIPDREYVYRGCSGKIYAYERDGVIAGTALVRVFTDEPPGSDLRQFMIDRRCQHKGCGTEALWLVLDELRRENHFDHVELCVRKGDTEAIHLYEKAGIVDSG